MNWPFWCPVQDNVALILVLEACDTGGLMDAQAASGKRGQLLCVVGIHLFNMITVACTS